MNALGVDCGIAEACRRSLRTNGRISPDERCRTAREPAMKGLANLPLVCCLTTAELRDREATLLAQFRSGVVETEELPDGYAFRIPGDASWIRLFAVLIVGERDCCPLLFFELAAEPNKGPITVRVTGPDSTKEFLRTILGQAGDPA